MGFENDLQNKSQFSAGHKMMPSLAFEKKEKITRAYDMIVQQIQNVCQRKCFDTKQMKNLKSCGCIQLYLHQKHSNKT